MADSPTHAVTGAFGYSGKYIAQRLLDKGQAVITLTNSPHRVSPFGEKVKAYPFNFDDPQALADSLKGVSVLYNTYWVRFNYKLFTHADAVRNTVTLFNAAHTWSIFRERPSSRRH
jgi:NADH dehydrogenase